MLTLFFGGDIIIYIVSKEACVWKIRLIMIDLIS